MLRRARIVLSTFGVRNGFMYLIAYVYTHISGIIPSVNARRFKDL